MPTSQGDSASCRTSDGTARDGQVDSVRVPEDDVRFEELCRVLDALAGGETSVRTEPSSRGDQLDRVMARINVLADRLAASEHKRRIHQAQHMEAMGTLAGGVAHNMNNVLAVVLGMSAVLEEEMTEHPAWRDDVREILHAAQRGRVLVQNMLGFARKGAYRKERIELVPIVEHVIASLRESEARSIRIETDLSDDLGPIEGDPAQLTQVVMNLCLNAADAIEEDGCIRIRTTEYRSAGGDPDELPPGRYAKLDVTDDGVGMDEECVRRACEPFFTTKDVGQGSGLGLAMVYGAVTQLGGTVRLASRLGTGTTATLFLPVVSPHRDAPPISGCRPTAPRIRTILVVDDEPMVLSVARRMLERSGDRALLADGGLEAIRVFRKHREQVDVVLLDLLMPDMDGLECLRRLKEIDPKVAVLLCTGYPGTVGQGLIEEHGARGLVNKPYSVQQLADAIEAVAPRQEVP